MRKTLFASAAVISLSLAAFTQTPAGPEIVPLADRWMLQSSEHLRLDGEQISKPSFRPAGWHATRVPSTVVAALVADKTLPDPMFGMNLRHISGTTYPVGANFAKLPMDAQSPYNRSWWYRTTFRVAAVPRGERSWLHFDGINYRANIWLNGSKIADKQDVVGTYRGFEFDVTSHLKSGENALAVEVFPPEPNDLAVTWVDWNPMPPDKNMGIWQRVYITRSGPVSLRNAFVKSSLSPILESADLDIVVDVRNAETTPVNGTLIVEIGTLRVEQPVNLAGGESKQVSFSATEFPSLHIEHPRLWWPYQLGTPNLYDLHMEYRIHGSKSDQIEARFGIREFSSRVDANGIRTFRVNGRPILIRGGGWAPDMLLREEPQKLRDEFAYVRDLRLNTIRLEGKMESEDFFDLADSQGILIMPGWCCCSIWEEWDKWNPESHKVATESLRSQLLRLRNRPSVFVWLYGSDNPPPPQVEKEYLLVIEQTQWPNPSVSSASAAATSVSGPSGVKMTGPYDYVPPSYWSNADSRNNHFGGAFGFNTETGPGPAIPTEPSLRKMLPSDHLWPVDDVWNFHAGGGEFKTLNLYNNAMKSIYGEPADLQDYLRKSQAMAYDGERAMFEAYRRRKYESTGIIQWMLNNAWPSTIWHLYDYYLQPAGGYFGAKNANEPVHIMFSYDDRGVVVVSDLPQAIHGAKATAEVFDEGLRSRSSQSAMVDVDADSVKSLFTIPEVADSRMHFLRLDLRDASGNVLSRNFYWLPKEKPTFDWSKSTFYYTPSPSYEDLKGLSQLPPASLEVSAKARADSGKTLITVVVKNSSNGLAFRTALRAFQTVNGDDVLPILWDDNYFDLLPGESRTISATVKPTTQPIAIDVAGWNSPSQIIPITVDTKGLSAKHP